MPLSKENGIYRLCARHLADQGYLIFHGATMLHAPGEQLTPAVDAPDILALHPLRPALRVFLQQNVGSTIYPQLNERTAMRTIYAQGYEDLKTLLDTGRPHVPAGNGSLF